MFRFKLATIFSGVYLILGVQLVQAISLDGNIQFDYSAGAFGRPQPPQVEAKVELQTPRKHGVRANIEFQSDDGTRNIELNDVYVDWRLEKNRAWSFRFGRARRNMGLENEDGVRTRIGLSRTGLYREMGQINWMSRDAFFRARYRDRNRYEFALHSNESSDLLLLLSVERELSERIQWVSWGSFMNFSRFAPENVNNKFALCGTGLRFNEGSWRVEGEAFAGHNPPETIVQSVLDPSKGQVYFVAARFALSRTLNKHRIYFQSYYFRPKLSSAEGQIMSFGPGWSYSIIRDLYFGVEINGKRRTSYVDENKSTWKPSEYRINLRYFL